MANHPNRRRPNLMFVENGYAHLVTVDDYSGLATQEVVTCMLSEGRYVRIDDGRQYPQLCAGGARLQPRL